MEHETIPKQRSTPSLMKDFNMCQAKFPHRHDLICINWYTDVNDKI